MIHVRLKSEFERLGVKPAAAAKQIGEVDSQGLRDVLGERKRLSADMLSSLAAIGVDVRYVLTGERDAPPPEVLTADERYLLERYRASPAPLKDAALRVLLGGEDKPAKKSKKQVFKEEVSGQVVMGRVVNKGIRGE